ncbi:MAG: glycosyltransferase family 4 protein [Muribaculum sp.]|nr:glycosyltransferase family 4 protein [Muribaculaceae bacterium]MCM1081309.1 glycosyltransferase family 4 protein [Muribaculum sp.]
MNSRTKILVLGNFGYANHDLSGQTIKTRAMEQLISTYGKEFDSGIFDTQTLCKKSNVFKMFRMLSKCDVLIYLPAHDNLKYIFPIIYLYSKIFRFDIVYSVIGGWLVHYLENLPLHRVLLKRIKRILAETTNTKSGLEHKYGFKNVDVLYNFRITDFNPHTKFCKREPSDKLRLVFMARIDPKKGLNTIFNLCEYIREKDIRNILIDFYGPIDPSVNGYFQEWVNSYDFVNYNGCLEPYDIYKTICAYDMLILPTQYYTEGLPGTIIEAYISGLPVLVTEWEHSREFVIDGETGIIIPFYDNQIAFNKAILEISRNYEKLSRLKAGAIEFSKQFRGDFIWNKLQKILVK